jgi:hypothetical protein
MANDGLKADARTKDIPFFLLDAEGLFVNLFTKYGKREKAGQGGGNLEVE